MAKALGLKPDAEADAILEEIVALFEARESFDLKRFVPVETMPDWLQWVAENQPITPIIETLRSLLMGTPMGDAAWWAVGWCLVIIAGSVAWGRWLFRRKSGRR